MFLSAVHGETYPNVMTYPSVELANWPVLNARIVQLVASPTPSFSRIASPIEIVRPRSAGEGSISVLLMVGKEPIAANSGMLARQDEKVAMRSFDNEPFLSERTARQRSRGPDWRKICAERRGSWLVYVHMPGMWRLCGRDCRRWYEGESNQRTGDELTWVMPG